MLLDTKLRADEADAREPENAKLVLKSRLRVRAIRVEMADVQSGNATPMSGLGALGGLPMLPMLPGMSGLPAFKKPGPPMIPRLPPPPEPALDSGDLALSLEPDAFRHIETAMEEHVKNEMNIRLDTGALLSLAR